MNDALLIVTLLLFIAVVLATVHIPVNYRGEDEE
jgi:hypothetical protein